LKREEASANINEESYQRALKGKCALRGWRARTIYYFIRNRVFPELGLKRGNAQCTSRPPITSSDFQLISDILLIIRLKLFDADWYLQQNPDVADAGVNPLVHYVLYGATGGRDPHPLFNSDWYLQQNPDVADAGVNPLVHYVRYGAVEGRDPHPLFNSDWYLQQNQDVADTQVIPLVHYIRYGAVEGRDPHPLFDSDWYLQQNLDVADAGVNPLAHYIRYGAVEGRSPHTLFDADWYLRQNPDVASARVNPLMHYIRYGAMGGRDPHPFFNSDWYLQQNPDVADAGVNPLVHYIRYGAAEGRDPNLLFDSDWYLQQNPSVAVAGINPFVHYLQYGAAAGRPPHPFFDNYRHLKNNPELAAAHSNLLRSRLRHRTSKEQALSQQMMLNNPSQKNPFEVRSIVTSAAENVIHLTPPVLASNNKGEQIVHGRPTAEISRDKMAATEEGAEDDIFDPLSGGDQHERGILEIAAEASCNEIINWDDYKSLLDQVSNLRKSRLETLQVKPPVLVSIPENEFPTCVASLEFAKETLVQVSIVIPVFNNLKFTLECLASIAHCTAGVRYEIIVVDDGSTDQTQEILSRVKNIIYVANQQSLDSSGSYDIGINKTKGKYILFINNDIQVTDGWLERLVNTFDQYENVGAVGPKILYPNGRLQEAGLLVNRDCSITKIGLNDDPDLPRYNYVREVGFCSSACLLVKAKMVKQSGGFNSLFAPADYDDCDLGFRLRNVGLRVLYNPKSVVIRHLGATLGQLDNSSKMQTVIRNQQKLSERWQLQIDNINNVRIIAFYSPQFYPIPENDHWRGKGFTEWTNVVQARPNYVGHYQPHLPTDLGFYDLRVEAVMKQQAELAKRYGINGFCFHYYWFAGKRRFDLPLKKMIESKEFVLPFCLAWANESWTRRWDGNAEEVLIKQQHSESDDVAFMHDIIRYMRCESYIRINGKPLLIVCRIALFPDIEKTSKIWREICRNEGLGEIYLAFVESSEWAGILKNPAEIGFDASVEFPPQGILAPVAPPGRVLNPKYNGAIHDYRQAALNYVQAEIPNHVRFRGVMPSWDNTPRRKDNATSFINATPGAFQAWLETVLQNTNEQNFGDERIVFINAWNEWAEGNHLEPDRRYGHGYLEAARNAQETWMIKSTGQHDE
jgi:O-antigen biosynthesis protein